MISKLENALKWITGILENLKIPYQISGGLAARIYGSGRPVNDIDIDVPEDRMEEIVPRVKKYIIQDLGRHKEKKWDLKLMVLDYHGQLIDISGAENIKIFNETSQEWELHPSKLNQARACEFMGLKLPVNNPKELLEYKRIMIAPGHEHHVKDAEAVEKFINENK